MKKILAAILASILIMVMTLFCGKLTLQEQEMAKEIAFAIMGVVEENHYQEHPILEQIPQFHGEPFVKINGNKPYFLPEEYTVQPYEQYSPLDDLGRCGAAMACVGVELMPTMPRGEIGHIKPTGWHSVRYDTVEGGSLYNRCHLLGFQLTGENANRENLITGTRFMNVEGMLPFENMIADFVIEMEEHVLYRVTPIYEHEEDLVAVGVLMEGWSVEDKGESICFCVFVYNAQPGIEIDYATGESRLKK